ncbi:cysteine protease [Desulfosarcina widdelii]|uniref:Cysteine protease n=1 Tax=Desulfosarcina widdelii TaxID=947919 RepID=A0A5K7ZD03_9BACT|nr:C1 family peptidase [Desulfosarcina widdelii]BBO78655.1 cysteine protease [Desulfosarcina widdelii]
MAESKRQHGMGWLPDLPDFRDYSITHKDIPARLRGQTGNRPIKSMLNKTGVTQKKKVALSDSVDLTPWCSPIENQGQLGSCTANAGAGLIEYFERRAFGKHLDASRLFLYKVTRNMLHLTGDTGAYLRTTMAAMTIFGVPPSEYWPYDPASFDDEPPAFCYAFAQNYQSIQFYRLDTMGITGQVLLDRIKLFLAAGLPSMFGFTVYSSFIEAGESGKIPFPSHGDRVEGGHAVVAVGYDDNLTVKAKNPLAPETTGALRIRNSWGSDWGDKGYGWLPYEYVRQGIAVDWWSLLKNEWIDTDQFKIDDRS